MIFMKKALSVFITALAAVMLCVTACAAAPEINEDKDAVTVASVSTDDTVIAAVYDDALTLIGVEICKADSEISINYKNIFDRYDNADHLRLFIWSGNMEPRMTAYGIDLSEYRNAGEVMESRDINIRIGEHDISATLSDNSSADAFLEILKKGPVTVDMSDYGGFEKVGALPESLPRNDERITTEPGDIILYQGNQITIYYDTNTWSFTRLGKVNGLSQTELKNILGSGSITAVFSIASATNTDTRSSKTLAIHPIGSCVQRCEKQSCSRSGIMVY